MNDVAKRAGFVWSVGIMRSLTSPKEPLLAGFSHRHEVFVEEMTRHPEHEMNAVQAGEALYHLEGAPDIPLRPGDLLLIPGGAGHAIEVHPPFHMAVIHFHPSILETIGDLPKMLLDAARALNAPDGPPACRKVLAPQIHERLVWLTEDAVMERSRRDPGTEAMLRVFAAQAAVLALRIMLSPPSETESDENSRRIRSVQSWIDRRFMEPCSIDWLAGLANLAPTYFAARFRELVGVPPMTYVRELRLRQACDLLERTGDPVKMIAWSVGYSDVSHFHHAFKRAMRMTPSEYRRSRHHKKYQ